MVRAPFLARYAAATSPLWPPPTTIASYRPASMRARIGPRRPAVVAASGGPAAGLGIRRGLKRLGRGVARHLAGDHLSDRLRVRDDVLVARPGARAVVLLAQAQQRHQHDRRRERRHSADPI